MIIDLQWLDSHEANDSTQGQEGGSGQLNRFEARRRSGIVSTCFSPVVQILSAGSSIGVL
jgi:hypothetical protein